MRNPFVIAVAIAGVVGSLAANTWATEYDLIIRGGTLIDGTGAPRKQADIAIDDGKIAAVGTLSADDTAARTIDAKGMIVAPGFIDVHTHVDDDIFEHPLAENFIRDGVTTIVSGNCGGSVSDVGRFFERMKTTPAAVNHATLYGHNTLLRKLKGGDVAGALTAEQIKRGQELVEQAMRDGAIGFATGLIYKPGTWSTTEEIIELAKPAGRLGGIYASHMRSEGTGIMKAIDEALQIGKEGGFSRVEISHFKLPTNAATKLGRGTSLKAGSDATLQKVEQARAAGQEVWVDQYPYTASSTGLTTMLPDWIFEKGPDEAKRICEDPEQLKKVLDDMRKTHEVSNGRKDMSYAVIASASGQPQYNGKSIKQVAQMIKAKQIGGGELLGDAGQRPAEVPVTMEDQYRAVIAVYLGGGASCVYHSMDETEVENIMRSPFVGVASDSGIRVFGSGVPHPRGYGTNARVLGRYSRELSVISLEEAIRKMTSLPAHAFRMDGRGAIRDGNWADVVIFDASKVADQATFEQPHQYSIGFTHVLVNGVEVFDGSKMTNEKPGAPIYGPAKQ